MNNIKGYNNSFFVINEYKGNNYGRIKRFYTAE